MSNARRSAQSYNHPLPSRTLVLIYSRNFIPTSPRGGRAKREEVYPVILVGGLARRVTEFRED